MIVLKTRHLATLQSVEQDALELYCFQYSIEQGPYNREKESDKQEESNKQEQSDNQEQSNKQEQSDKRRRVEQTRVWNEAKQWNELIRIIYFNLTIIMDVIKYYSRYIRHF